MGDNENMHEVGHHVQKNRESSDHLRVYVVLVGLKRFIRIRRQLPA